MPAAQICVARIGAPHGIRGAVKLWTFTEDPLAVMTYGQLKTKDGGRTFEVATAREADATAIVVGLPLSLSGREGPAAQAALVEVDELRNVAGPDFEVTVHDERLTTVVAERALREARMKRDARRQVVDKVAAAVMLQSWLENGGK